MLCETLDFFYILTEGNVWIRREMSTIPLMDMTDVDIKQLSTAILTEFTKVGFTCPERARSMLAFGK